jgi:8-oxo-dGTP pyrophosphatase MutT (NUDIX family)
MTPKPNEQMNYSVKMATLRPSQPLIHCSNCNKLGHYFRECKEPITSYGIIAYRIKQPSTSHEPAVLNGISKYDTINGLDEKQIEFLMIQRKDTLGYVEFMRGKYNVGSTDYIQTLFHQMTHDELGRLMKYDFETLWNSLWNNQISRQYKQEYDNALAKYVSLKEGKEDACGKTLDYYIQHANREWTTPEWGFPKGRRGNRESEITCAIREFTEETGLEESQFILVKNLLPLEENFLGGNRIQYRHRYYLAYCKQSTEVQIDSTNAIMNREIGDIGWYNYEQALDLIRPYNIEKRQILSVANEILSNYIILPGREYLKLTSSSGVSKKVTPFQIVERNATSRSNPIVNR